MARDTTEGVGRWRQARPTRTTSTRARVSLKKWVGIALLSGVLAVAAGGLIWIVILWVWPSGPRTRFVPLMIDRYQRPEVPPLPWVEAERRLFHRAQLFGRDAPEEGGEELTREVVIDRLAKLERIEANEAVIVYLASHALIDDTAKVQVVAYDSDPHAPKTLLPLHDILSALSRCPARNKLLVLDIMPAPSGPLDLGGTADGLADLIGRELGRGEDPGGPLDPRLAVLAASSPGESGLWSEAEGRSIFAHFFIKAFTDPQADVDQDHAISVDELGGYLARTVDQWALQHRGRHQRPLLLGSKKKFPLAIVDRRHADLLSRPTRPEGGAEKKTAEEKAAEEKAPEKEKATDKGKSPEKEKAPDREKAPKEGATRESGAGEVYPQWLADGWALRARWVGGGEFQAAPRLFRRLEALLARAELEWRVGKADEAIQSRLNEDLRALGSEMEAVLRVDLPSDHSVGQARAFGRPADPALVKGLKALLERRRKPQPFATPEQIKAQLDEAVKAFLGTLKEKTSLDLARAIADATSEDRFDRDMIQFLNTLVDGSGLGLDVVELRTLRELAVRAAAVPPGERDDEAAMAKQIWDTVLLAEEANNRPLTLAWVRGQLDGADALRHDAEILLLPKALNFASRAQITRAWLRVAEAYGLIDGAQERIRRARLVLARARAVLPAYLSYLEGTGRAAREAEWHEAAQVAIQLDRLLEKTATSEEAEPLSRQGLEQLNGDLGESTPKLEAALAGLLRPFESEALHALARQCESSRPGPELAEEVECILSTPFPAAQDRARLWRAAQVLDRRLGDLPSAPSGPTSDAPVSLSERAEAVRELGARRARRVSALLQLATSKADVGLRGAASGPAPEPGAPARPSNAEPAMVLSVMAQSWGALARASGNYHDRLLELAGRDQDDRPGWMAPAFALGSGSSAARQQARDRAYGAARAWLASHYLHESLDLHDLVDTDRFFETAAQECARSDRLAAETWLELAAAEGSATATGLSAQRNRADIGVRLIARGTGADGEQEVTLDVIPPDDRRLSVAAGLPRDIKLTPREPRTETIRVRWDEEGAGEVSGPPPSGLIVRARLRDRRAYHLLVPLSISPAGSTPRLVLRTDPGSTEDLPFDRLRLRAVPGRQGYVLFVKNPSSSARDVIVEILAGSVVVARNEKAFPVKAGSTVQVPGFGAPVPKPEETLKEAPAGLRIRLRDAAADRILDEQPLQPAIAVPQEYLEVSPPHFIPAVGGQPNRLEVSFQSLPQMTGPPCPIRLIIPSDKEVFPAYREPPKGKLEGELKPGGDRLDLFAEDIALDPSAPEEGRFQITIDNLERVLWYQTRFIAQEAKPQSATPFTVPRVRFRPEILVKPGERARLHVVFQVDNAPDGSRLRFELGRLKDGKLATDLRPWEAEAKRRRLGFDPRGEGGVLLFEAAVEDWSRDFDIAQIRGLCRLQASLIDPRTRQPFDTWGMDLPLDDLPPQIAAIEVPKEIEKGVGRVEARAAVRPAASGIKEVAFIVGTKADFAKADADVKAIKGKSKGSDQGPWEATLPVAPDATGKITVTVRATSGNGLTALESAEVAVREPPPPPQAGAGKPKPDEPGAIQGKVTENDIAQPGLTVYLIDPKAKEMENPIKDQKKTGPGGAFSFTDLKPGPYRLWCVKDATRRQDIKDVTVEPGKTLKQDLDLLLP
jgi:hypothetical protein